MSDTTGDTPPTGENPERGGSSGALDENEQLRKDTAYSPGSETETAARQDDGLADTIDEDIDEDLVTLAPGTGGPDDAGDVDVPPEELNMPWRDDQ